VAAVVVCFYACEQVKDKMLYASTRATVKRSLGANFFCDELHGTVATDISSAGYEAHKAHVNAAQPLTHAEFARQEELELGEIYTGGSSTYEATNALKQLVSGGNNYVQLSVDIAKETITLGSSKQLTLGALKNEVSLTEPQFHFLRHVHASFDGECVWTFLLRLSHVCVVQRSCSYSRAPTAVARRRRVRSSIACSTRRARRASCSCSPRLAARYACGVCRTHHV
jgi:hypothetical protein